MLTPLFGYLAALSSLELPWSSFIGRILSFLTQKKTPHDEAFTYIKWGYCEICKRR
ncbi:hypothetical protein PFLA_a1693 [Pseudoalteromonas flavipulchra NCIMB 2033 = ATCC BAA-314]|nr:hypothetical protein [Pseudoalteromonas flavipulchra NCIMB 2033 = ATCC BAA-314]